MKTRSIALLLCLCSANAAMANDCYQSLADFDGTLSFEMGAQSVSCELYEEQRQNLFFNGDLDGDLREIQNKIKGLESEIVRTKQQLDVEKAREADAGWQYAIDVTEAIDETADAIDDVARALAKRRPRDIPEVLDEVLEAEERVSAAIDSMADHDTAQILRKSTEDLLERYADLKIRWESVEGTLRQRKDKFMEMCAVVKANCVTPEIRMN